MRVSGQRGHIGDPLTTAKLLARVALFPYFRRLAKPNNDPWYAAITPLLNEMASSSPSVRLLPRYLPSGFLFVLFDLS